MRDSPLNPRHLISPSPLHPPTVSVILPTWNRGWIICRAVDSVLAQTHSAFELIVVDDGSTDDTLQVLERYTDPRIKIIRRPHGGASAARNAGIAHATGEYLTFIDSDDEYMPAKLGLQVARFRESDYDDLCVVLCSILAISDRREYFQQCTLQGFPVEQILGLYPGSSTPTPTIMVRREFLGRELLFDESLITCEDRDLILRLALSWRLDTVETALVRSYRSSKWAHLSDHLTQGRSQFVAKHSDLYRRYPRAEYRAHRKLAQSFRQAGDSGQFRSHMKTALSTGHATVKDHISLWADVVGIPPGLMSKARAFTRAIASEARPTPSRE